MVIRSNFNHFRFLTPKNKKNQFRLLIVGSLLYYCLIAVGVGGVVGVAHKMSETGIADRWRYRR
jgi:hypothetical protein